MTIIHTIDPVSHDLGAFEVRRVLPSPKRTMVGPFIFVDEFGPARLPAGKAMDVRPHPHIGLATVTWLFRGAIDHRDSLGNFATIRPGQVNLMTAGRGIAHSERSPESERFGGALLFGMQTWLALPDGQEEIAPDFESRTDLQLIEDAGVSARVIMGSLWGERAPTTCHSETIYAEIFLQPDGALPIRPEAEERAVMLVGGEADLDGTPLTRYQLAVLKPGAELLLSTQNGARAMLLGGAAFSTRRHVWWNFVSSNRERIEQAKADWMGGKFPKVVGDEIEWIPIPERPLTKSE